MTGDSPWAIPSHPLVYESIGRVYREYRRADARIAAQIARALGAAQTVCNVGAGTGAYEPTDRLVVAVEPSPTMYRQRSNGAVRAVAEALPFADHSFEAATAFLTVHHWQDLAAGLREMCRIAPHRVILAFELALHSDFWLVREYLPEIATPEAHIPSLETVAALVEATRIETVPVPWDCTDGFLCAYWRRPEMYLNADARACISGIAQLDPAIVERGVARLRSDLESGAWEREHADLLGREQMDYGYRLVVSDK